MEMENTMESKMNMFYSIIRNVFRVKDTDLFILKREEIITSREDNILVWNYLDQYPSDSFSGFVFDKFTLALGEKIVVELFFVIERPAKYPSIDGFRQCEWDARAFIMDSFEDVYIRVNKSEDFVKAQRKAKEEDLDPDMQSCLAARALQILIDVETDFMFNLEENAENDFVEYLKVLEEKLNLFENQFNTSLRDEDWF